jgi:hypothetical protein
MGVIRDIPLNLEIGEVVRWQGIRDTSKITHELKSQIVESLDDVKKAQLLEPCAAYETYSITGITQDQIVLGDNKVIHSPLWSPLLCNAKELAVVVCTIGPKLEKQANHYFEHGETLRGLILDGIGNAAMTSLNKEVYDLITAEASSHDYQTGSPIRPGIRSGLPITEQWQLFKLAPVDAIGVSLTEKGIMVPLKSASMIIGIGPEITGLKQGYNCAKCSINKTCTYRIQDQVRPGEDIEV